MLKIIDLNRNEELSASAMGKVAGGMPCSALEPGYSALVVVGQQLQEMGFTAAASNLLAYGQGLSAACSP
jgi:hypothetical protein